jgi:hypothetical protein
MNTSLIFVMVAIAIGGVAWHAARWSEVATRASRRQPEAIESAPEGVQGRCRSRNIT